ncbi:MAG: hypothetical protein M3495_19925 [Pseudomonadota bacterium]|nr:hypothetical protein [Gammaproteobacteria bacterium]MDQ3583725.1 hypothetical protein [Pseudomonadota bacterium]
MQFAIPDGPDCLYRVYNHRYLLTHGHQFRGGDGMIGALGPIIRGDHKKRSRNGQIDMGYDTLVIGHWHQLIELNRLIRERLAQGLRRVREPGQLRLRAPASAAVDH